MASSDELAQSSSASNQVSANNKKWLSGCVGWMTVYNLLTDQEVALLQCLFFEATENDRFKTHVLIFCAPLPQDINARSCILTTFAGLSSRFFTAVTPRFQAERDSDQSSNNSINVQQEQDSSNQQNTSGDILSNVRRDRNQSRVNEPILFDPDGYGGGIPGVQNKSNVLSRIILTAGGEASKLLSRFFQPIQVLTDGCEIYDVRPWQNVTIAFFQGLATLDVARFSASGTYYDDSLPVVVRSENDDTPVTQSEIGRTILSTYKTHSGKKFRRGYSIKSLTFNIDVNGKSLTFEQTTEISERSRLCPGEGNVCKEWVGSWPIKELFRVREIFIRGRRLRLCSPRGFLALCFSDEQCLGLLREAIHRMFKDLYAGFVGLTPLFDCLSPNLFLDGSKYRSVFYTGFPAMCIYSVPWRRSLKDENGLHVINEVRSLCGLPDILGPSGKYEVVPSSGGALDMITGEKAEAVDVCFSDFCTFRHNGRWFSIKQAPESIRPCFDFIYFYVADDKLLKISIPELRYTILHYFLRGSEFPFILTEHTSSRIGWVETTAFIDRLRFRSPFLFSRIRATENFISRCITDVCEKHGYNWVLVRHDAEFYVRTNQGKTVADLQVILQRELMDIFTFVFCFSGEAPAFSIVEGSGGALVTIGNHLFSGFSDTWCDGFETPGWIYLTGRLLCDAVQTVFREGDWTCRSQIRQLMGIFILQLAARRHDVAFWLERFSPGKYIVSEHEGILDATQFSGIRLIEKVIAVQSKNHALNDNIYYEQYMHISFDLLLICIHIVTERLLRAHTYTESGRYISSSLLATPTDSTEANGKNVDLDLLHAMYDEVRHDVQRRYSVFFHMN